MATDARTRASTDKSTRRHRRRLKERSALAHDDGNDGNQRESSPERAISQLQIMELPQFDVEGQDGDDDAFYGDGSHDSHDTVASVGGEQRDVYRVREYVEHEISGAFFRVQRRADDTEETHGAAWHRGFRSLRPSHKEPTLGSDGADASNTLWWSSCGSIWWRDLDSALVAMCHGITTGLSWMDAFSLSTSHSFLDAAAKTTLLGQMLRFSRLRYEPTRDRFDAALRNYRQRSLRLVAAVLGLTMTAMLVLLLSSPAAVRLTNAQQSGPSSSWCHDAASSDYQRYQSALKTLQVSSIVKAVLLSVAWFLLCLQFTLGMSSAFALRNDLHEARSSVGALEERLCHLDGRRLENLSVEDIKMLIQTHQVALERSQTMLVTKLKSLNPTAFQT